ncbi:MAG: carboxypeptidase regulatory-like domain-containing protein [Gemmatimonadota bacterium]|uniref:SdrD B-like domain-containing protein n=1 Tax=Candidatus Palauibacter scopulicola TaxID=3056741 RepID=UPI002390E0ED|nr:SdrD B-like domain-containing protein [Candidatus Palauibacter scopulicola]MDE2664385.1 carboxypeptidase regulatory-like domain-containing protein [Candidatus Palauibacter scopulicola]
MSRLKQYLAAATLFALPIIAACGEDVMPPPPTGDIVGQVSIEGMGVDGVSVSLSNGASTATAGGGNYRFDTVEQGSYTVTISGFPADASFDATSAPASIGDTGGTVTVDFRGTYIRTASIMGTVTVENMGLGGVTVSLSGMADGQTTTDDSGQYSFTGLRAGTYSVEISSFDTNEVSFSSTSGAATVGVGESKVVSFDGTYLRTAGIQGQVSVDGEGLQGVTVTLVGEGEDRTEVTNASGLYGFSQLKSGTYQVAITNPDPEDYEFTTTSKSATVATGETANVPFEGTLLRTAGIAGRVSLDDGMGLDGVTVTLAGAAEATATTSGGGQYSFAGLAAGTYVLSIANPNPTAYNFAEAEMQKTVMLADDQSAIVNFSGTHTRTASVSGMLFIDEVMQDKMHNDGEPSITEAIAPLVAAGALDAEVVAGLLAKAKVKLRGPDLNTETDIAINADGSFSTGESLMAGSYQVELPVNDDDVAAGLEAAGIAFVGESMVVTVEAGGSATANFPFRITMQTVATGARMGAGDHLGVPVPGVKLALYARADGTGMLGEATTDKMGMASFTFARADNTGPGGNDNIVFVKTADPGHADLKVSGNEFVEIAYASTARLYAADADEDVATLVNVAVAFDFWVKSNEMARDGDMGLGGWNTQVYMGDPKAKDAKALMMVDEDGDTVNATMPTNDGKKNMDDLGKSSFAYTVDPTMLPAMFTVMAAAKGQPDMGEAWEQGDALTLTHTGLDLPPGKDDDMLDLGPLRVTFTTQAIYVGVHRELDDRTGYTDYIGLGDGDGRPEKDGSAVGEIEITLMTADSRGRLRAFEYDHDADPKTDDKRAVATAGASGMVSFKNIPTDTEITVVADEGSGMVIVPDSRASREIDAFGDQLDDHPDGVIVGAFGDMGGARPDVWLCPLQRQTSDDPNEVCSTYAYKWATGTISGSISGLDKGDKATVSLTPVNSNDDYADDLEDDVTVTAGNGGAAKYTFTDVADGRYRATLAAKAGSWQEDETGVLSVMHDEGDDDDEYTGDSASGNLDATNLRGVVRGRIANDSNGRSGLTSDESRAGVKVAIYTAKKVGGSGTTKNNYVADKAVADADGDPLMAETDRDGVYVFEGLTRDDMYFVKPQGTDLYAAVRNGNTKIGAKAEKATDVVSHALVTAGSPPAPGSEPGIPTWNYHTSTASVGAADFVLLYKDGEVEGDVMDPSVRAAHSRAVVELQLCKTTAVDTTTTPSTVTGCDDFDDVVVEASVDAKGNWSAEGLMEGYYEVTPDLPAGYISVNASGGTTADDPNTLFTQQVVELMGGRADDDTETFYIKDRNAGSGATLEATIEVDGTDCTPTSSPTNAAPQCGHSDDGEFSVVVTASSGATIRLSSSATDATPSGSGTYSQAVTNGRATTVTLPRAGTRTYYIHVAAEDGYSANDASAAGFSIRRDADVRVKEITITWNGDRIELDRDGLNLDPDGETDPVTGTTTLRVTVDKGDNNGAIPTTDLTVAAASMTTGFGVVGFGTVDVTTTNIACSSADFTGLSGTSGTLTLPANSGSTKGSDGVCFRILDSDGDSSDPDQNANNTRDYILIVTRK